MHTEKEMPKHIAVIMDGNGRWAKKRNKPRLYGHREGAKAFEALIENCNDLKIPYLTVYMFSTENWKRPAEEVSGIFGLLEELYLKKINKLIKNDVRLHFIGNLSALPDSTQKTIQACEEKTKQCRSIQVNVAINYGGRDEIKAGVKALIEAGVKSDEVTEEVISSYLYTKDIPDPDLVIRTSGEMRLSNFLTWQTAYSELYFTDTLWPDFDKEELIKAVTYYQNRDRRFGGIAKEDSHA